MDEDTLLNSTRIAELLGIKRTTWNAYVYRAECGIPQPDVYAHTGGHVRKMWRTSTIEAWRATRPRSKNRK